MIIALNHKSNLTLLEIKKYEKILRDYDVIVFPQIVYLPLFNNGAYHLGSQIISEEIITGGVSAKALKSLDVEYVLIKEEKNDSQYEEEYIIGKKIDEAINNKLIPILCINDTKEEMMRNKSIYNIERKINKIITNSSNKLNNIIIAYNPTWLKDNIKDNLDYIDKVLFFIKSYFKDNYNYNVKVILNGNINSKNIKDLLNLKTVEGFLLEESSTDIYETINVYGTING